MIIFGIDPGSEKTGYGVVEKRSRSKLVCLAYGCIITPRTKSRAERLLFLEKELSSLLSHTKPDVGAVESLFFFKNLKTVMPVSEARGIALFALAKHKIPVYEFSPLQIKMAIAGHGRAEKGQVQRMVKEILCLEKIPKPDDAADGLAAAITCSLVLRSLPQA
ncbi:MAG: crossover junction endodeoxyribonuclease RuvC [Patescibacteria group bacterium]